MKNQSQHFAGFTMVTLYLLIQEPSCEATVFDLKTFTLPSHFSRKVTAAITDGKLGEPDNRAAFVREVVAFYEGILPNPSLSQYEAISRKIVEKYPCLQDTRSSKYWVSCLM